MEDGYSLLIPGLMNYCRETATPKTGKIEQIPLSAQRRKFLDSMKMTT